MSDLPKPCSRTEQYLNFLAKGEGELPVKAQSRLEQYLKYIAENGGVSGDGVSKNYVDGKLEEVNSQMDAIENEIMSTNFNIKDVPMFERVTDSPFWTLEDSGLPSMAKPYVIRTDKILSNAKGKYYMYYSADHGSVVAGIQLAYSDNPTHGFVKYGTVLSTGTSGHDYEDVEVHYDEKNNRLLMYCHKFSTGDRNQTNYIFESTDGINWSIITEIKMDNMQDFIGDNHTGYCAIFRTSEIWYMYTLLGGRDFPRYALWRSYDGVDWYVDNKPLGYNMQFAGANRLLDILRCAVMQYKGTYYCFTINSNIVSGSTPKNAYVAGTTLSNDFRKVTSPTYNCLIGVQPTWESSNNYRSTSLLFDKGDVYLYYNCNYNFGVAKLVTGGKN